MPTDWYDYPQYWDMAFADETKPEADFLDAAFAKYAIGPVRRVLEPGCGSGRLVIELARRGYRMTGFDLNDRSLDYLRDRLRKRKLRARLYRGDMTDFQVPRPLDAVINTFGTVRHLLTEEAATSHVQCVAASLRPGGLFVLGLHLLPPDASLECTERWRAQRGKTQVCYTLRVVESSRRQRFERMKVSLLARTPRGVVRCSTEFSLRMYTAAQLRQLLARVPELELCDVFDYRYDIEEPLRLDNELSDTVLVLRRR